MRKFLSFFFSIALAMTMLPAAAFAVPDDGESQLVDVPQAPEAALVIEPQVGNIATGTWGTCPWEISEDGVLTVRPGEGANTTDVNYSPWIAYVDSITKVVFVRDGGKRVIAPATCTALFARMPNITEIDFSGFDTSKTTAMNEMFIQCTALTSVDFSNLDTSNVTTTMTMFGGCISLASINLSGVNTSKLRWADYMFSGCSSLESIDVSSFNTSNVTSMFCMFNGCSSLKSLDLSSFDTSNVTNVRNVLSGCSSLAKLKLGTKTTNLVVPSDEVDGKTDWYSFELHARISADEINSSRLGVVDTYIKGEPGVWKNGAWGTCPWEISEDGILTIHPGVGSSTRSPWRAHSSQITKIVFASEEGGMVIAPGSLADLFAGLKKVKEIDFMGFDTSGVKDMSHMFWECYSLQGLDLSNFVTAEVKNMEAMFSLCSSLDYVDLHSFDTTNVTNMKGMFLHCDKLASLDITSFDTSNVTDMCGMFYGCKSISSLDLSSLRTSNVTSMGQHGYIDGVYGDYGMFTGCSSLVSLDLSSFDTSSVASMGYMFYGCSSLRSLDLANFQTFRVTNMNRMFSGCSSLEALDLSGFSTAALESYTDMLKGCDSLKSISLGQNITKFPMPGIEWLSRNENKWFTADEIRSSRLGIADTYTDFRTPLDAVTIDYEPKSYVYTGRPIKPNLTLTNKETGYKLIEGKDYTVSVSGDLVGPGIVKLTISGKGGYKGSVTKTIEIVDCRVSLGEVTIDYGPKSYVYTGKPIKPNLTLTNKETGYKLIEGKDYTISFLQDNVNVGVVDYYIVGIGNYKGSDPDGAVANSFEITPAPITSVEVLTPRMVWDHAMAPPTIVVKSGNHILAEDADYTHNWYGINGGVGKRTLSVEATGRNYTGTKQYEVEIIAAPISAAYLDCESFYPNGTDIRPHVQCVDVEREGYTTSYANDGAMEYYDVVYPEHSSQPGIYYVTVKGKNNCTGTVTAKYEILPDSNSDVDPILPPDTPDTPDDSDIPNLPAPVSIQTMFRLYNPNSGEHFYTSSTVERDSIIAVGWQDEGTGWIAPTEGDPVYRLYNQYAGEHHYTTSAVERDMLVSVGWNDEGIGWYAGGERPLYRLYNPNAYANNHHYSTDVGERDILISIGWQDEGIAWYGVG